MKGLFIPGITAEMFRNGCLESIEALMSEGKIFDIDTDWAWVPVSETLPEKEDYYLTSTKSGNVYVDFFFKHEGKFCRERAVVAWMPLPEPWEGEEK